MIPSATKAPQTGGVLLFGMAVHDKNEQTRRAAEATEKAASDQADARTQRLAHARAARAKAGRAAANKDKGPPNKGRDARAARESEGANASRGNKDVDENKSEDEEEEEDETKTKANDLFWKHLVWGAYRSKKARGEE